MFLFVPFGACCVIAVAMIFPKQTRFYHMSELSFEWLMTVNHLHGEMLIRFYTSIKMSKITQKHLLGIQDLSISDVRYILSEAKQFITLNRSKSKKLNILRGKTQINLFF